MKSESWSGGGDAPRGVPTADPPHGAGYWVALRVSPPGRHAPGRHTRRYVDGATLQEALREGLQELRELQDPGRRVSRPGLPRQRT
jgi:hypothetical protein